MKKKKTYIFILYDDQMCHSDCSGCPLTEQRCFSVYSVASMAQIASVVGGLQTAHTAIHLLPSTAITFMLLLPPER